MNSKSGMYKHGMWNTRIYRVYYNIRARCTQKSNRRYERYGGRGIKCEWNSFEEFYEDMKEGYSDNLSIDRIDNDGNYHKENCRWATAKEQSRNTSRTRIYNGLYIKDWADRLGIPESTIRVRLHRGSTIKDAIFGKF